MRDRVIAVGFVWIFGLLGSARAEETFRTHAVVCQEGNAAEAGREVMKRGGNAIDAAVATAFALAVTHPAAGNIGGGGFIVAYLANTKEVVTVDFREMAPQASTETMYLGPNGLPLPGHREGPKAAGVPGSVRGLGLAHAKWGKAAWADLVKPAARLARDGFPVSATLAGSLNGQLFPRENDKDAVPEDLGLPGDRLGNFASSTAAFKKPDGSRWREGDLLIQRDLAETLDRIALHGPDEFYTGQTARKIVAYMNKLGGVMTLDDLAAYQAKIRPPIRGTYKGFDVFGMGPPASGGILIVEMLNILEHFDLKADGPRSPKTLHRVTEAMRWGFKDRALAIADPDFFSVPIEKLTAKSYAAEIEKFIREHDKATPSEQIASIPIIKPEGTHTTHLSTIDGQGNAVALTTTLEEGYGSKAVVEGAGFLLNNEMGDFNLVPGRTESTGRIGTPPNLIAPKKRMLSSMSPTIILKDGKVRLVTGSPGGRTIPNTTLWVVLNILEFGLSPRAAVDAPRTHHQWFPDVLSLEGQGWPTETRDDLRGLGYQLKLGGSQGDAHTIAVDPDGTIHGTPDLRRRTSKAAGD